MISQIWFGFLREYIKFSVFHFTIESPAARAYRCRRCSAPNMIIHLHRVVYTETIVYAPRVANIRTDAECNEWQAGEPSRWQRNGSSSVTSSPFGIRIALPSFRFHFGKQLRPEIASGKRASGAHHTPMRIAFLRARATRRFSSFHSHLALKRTHSRNNRNGKTIGKSQLDAFGVAECILNAHTWWRVQNRLNAFARQPWNSDGDEQMNGLIFRMHCGDNEKELKIEIQQAAGHRSGENAPKKMPPKGRGFCGVLFATVNAPRFTTFDLSLHFSSSLRRRVCELEFIHMAEKTTVRHTWCQYRALPVQVRNMRNGTLEMYANTCSMFMRVCVQKYKNPLVLTRYMWHRKTFNAAKWWRSTTTAHTHTSLR